MVDWCFIDSEVKTTLFRSIWYVHLISLLTLWPSRFVGRPSVHFLCVFTKSKVSDYHGDKIKLCHPFPSVFLFFSKTSMFLISLWLEDPRPGLNSDSTWKKRDIFVWYLMLTSHIYFRDCHHSIGNFRETLQNSTPVRSVISHRLDICILVFKRDENVQNSQKE